MATNGLVIAYHPSAAFWAGRFTDRLALRFGDEAMTILHHGRHPHPGVLAAIVAEHDAMMIVLPDSRVDGRPWDEPHVHLLTSLAARYLRPVLAVHLGEPDADPKDPDAPQDLLEIIHVAVDPDRFDAEFEALAERLTAFVGGARSVPRGELGATMVPAFVGSAERGPIDTPVLVRTWSDHVHVFGESAPDSNLHLSVWGWFVNGGRDCYVVRVGDTSTDITADTVGPDPGNYGSASGQRGIGALARFEDVTAIILPDLVLACAQPDGSLDRHRWQAIQSIAIADAEQHDRMALLDPPPGMTPLQVRDWRIEQAGFDSSHACLHYPWITVADPVTGDARSVPPSGHVAGSWARSDRERAVWRSPANQVIRGALDVAEHLTRDERFFLSPVGINPVRAMAGEGIRVWGSRTLSVDPNFASLELARFIGALRRACGTALRWSSFEPPTAATRAAIVRQLETFLTELWRAGALVGERPGEAFEVQCSVLGDRGELVVRLGVAPHDPGNMIWLTFGGTSGESGSVDG